MKKFLLVLLALVSVTANSQTVVLTKAFNEPAIGDDDTRRALDTSAFTTGLPTNVTGANVVWNYTNLNPRTPVFITSYVPPSVSTSSASFPGCTVVQQDAGPTYTFLKSTSTPTTQTEILGLILSTYSLTFSNSAIAAIYPMSFGANITDNFSGAVSAFSQNGNCTGTIVTTADGSGTLMLPGGLTFTDVLRVKSVQNLSFTQGFIPLGTAKQTTYSYYHASEKFPILSINYSSIKLLTSPTPTVTGVATGIFDKFPVGLKENVLDNSALNIYPNPAAAELNITLDRSYLPNETRIYSQLGQLVYQKDYSATVDLSALQSGIYFLEVRTDKGIVRKKLVKT